MPGVLLVVVLAACSGSNPSESTERSGETRAVSSNSHWVIAHRGASGYLPEHTLAAYAMAHAQGADFIEPDLVMTRDGHLICLHDIHLDGTTNVAEIFPDRRRDDGRWYAADMDLAEIKRLRVHERLETRFPQDSSARFEVPTLEEMIELVQGLNRTTGRDAGIYPELKAPSWHRDNDLPMEEKFLAVVNGYGYRGPEARIFVQCFESEPLDRMRQLGSQLPQVFLIGDRARPSESSDEPDPLSDPGLDRIATFAQGIGPYKNRLLEDPSVVERAHQRGLVVHPYTFRADQLPLKDGEQQSFDDELEHFYETLGVDAVFTDFPDRARKFLDSRR